MGFFSSISHAVSHGTSSITHGISHGGGSIFHSLSPPPFVNDAAGSIFKGGKTLANSGYNIGKNIGGEVKDQVNIFKGVENSVAGGIKGLSGLASSPMFLLAAGGLVVTFVVLK